MRALWTIFGLVAMLSVWMPVAHTQEAAITTPLQAKSRLVTDEIDVQRVSSTMASPSCVADVPPEGWTAQRAADEAQWYTIGLSDRHDYAGPGTANALVVVNSTLYAGGAYGGGISPETELAWFDGSSWRYIDTPLEKITGMIAVDKYIYAGGKEGNFNEPLGRYDTTTGTWTVIDIWGGLYDLEEKTSMVVIGTTLYVGGSDLLKVDLTQTPLRAFPVVSAFTYVNTLASYGTDLFIGGGFSGFTTIPGSRAILRYNTQTQTLTSVGGGIGGDGVVSSLLVSGSDLFVAGRFSQVGGQAAQNLARYDLRTQEWHTLGQTAFTGYFGTSTSALAANEQTLFVGGSFSGTYDGDGTTMNAIARWDRKGQSWSPIGSGAGGIVRSLLLQNESLIVGGDIFKCIGGKNTSGIAGWKITGDVAPTPVAPTPTPTPDKDTTCGFTRPTQTRAAGGVTVYAATFSGDAANWTASGTVWIGDYTVLEGANVQGNSAALSGTGVVHMVTTADGSQCPALFRDSFDVNGGMLKPRAVNGDWRLTNIIGFAIERPPTALTLDVKQGVLNTTLNLKVVIPQNTVVEALTLTVAHTGDVAGTLSDIDFTIGRVKLHVDSATLDKDGVLIQKATMTLPVALGGAKAALDASATARISGDGTFTLVQGKVKIAFPNVRVGGAKGFGIEDSSAILEFKDNTYLFTGAGTFVLPGVGKTEQGACKVGTSFTFASTPPSVREASLAINGCGSIPIDGTGFFLTSISGKVQLDEGDQIAIDVGIGISGGPDIPKVGPAVSGNPSAHWDNSWKIGLSGTLKVFKFDVAQAALELSKQDGFKGTLHISLAGVVEGNGSIHIWKDQSSFHFTGRQEVQISSIERGQIVNKCVTGICLVIPTEPIAGPRASADFGEFMTNSSSLYGLKGMASIAGFQTAFFIGADGTNTFSGAGEYQLAGLARVQSADQMQSTDVRSFSVAPNTPTLLVGLATARGAPTLSLLTPAGQTLTAGSPGVLATTTTTQTLLAIANPAVGQWKASVNNINSGDQYIVAAFGTRPAATLAAPIITPNGDGSYTIGLAASSTTPTSTISLFDDTSPISRTGKPIAQSLPLTTTTYLWRPTAATNGTHYLYAMVDDPRGVPVYAYSATPITINDATPPRVPAGLGARGNSTNALISWQANAEADLAGYRIYYQEPDGGTLFVADVPRSDQTTYTQGGLYLNGGWRISISAYDINGNESVKSALSTVVIGNNGLYLPLIAR